jgi:hypothetical protein
MGVTLLVHPDVKEMKLKGPAEIAATGRAESRGSLGKRQYESNANDDFGF